MAQFKAKDGSKLWMELGLGCGGTLLAPIGGGISYFASRPFNLSVDPEEAAAAARKIADYEIPGGGGLCL